ncbi:hypothetical protein AB0L63_25635 [Nocardia sp. NPDC051990]|uniref:hypothetical protein n=1 Tax=Nocardia sp. NPDC051990 TaxID=3155285 RepID=UPI0034450421
MKLTPPPGASAGLKAFIAMAEEAIQTAVDLLGRGTPELPPKVDDLLRPVIYESIGDSLMKTQYEQALAKVQSRQTALLTYDTKVMKTSIVVAAGSDETLRAIKGIVTELQTKLKAAGSGKLKPAQEVALMKLVAEAIDLVYEKVEAVYQLNQDMAGNGNNGSDGGGSGGGGGQSGSGGSGGGGGDGGLGQMMSMLAMLPMMAMPLVSQLPQLLKPHGKDKDKDKDAAEAGAKTGEGQPAAAAPGAAPGSPAPAPAAPGTGQPVAAAPAASASAPAASATPVANMSPVSARTNVRRAVNRTGSTPTDADTNEAHKDDLDDDVTVDSPVVQA